jgi:hypothetical protein
MAVGGWRTLYLLAFRVDVTIDGFSSKSFLLRNLVILVSVCLYWLSLRVVREIGISTTR